MTHLDLTPFGFTPTESLAYRSLTQLGPLTGYGLAHALSIARANAYQALRGLVTKGAVSATGERPERYRPLQPSALVELIAKREALKLGRLETQLAQAESAGAPGLVAISGERALIDAGMRTAARAGGRVTCIAPARLLASLAPAWHKRAAEKADTRILYIGDAPAKPLPWEPDGRVETAAVVEYFGAPLLLMVTPEAAIFAALPDGGPAGYWTSDPVLRALVRLAADLLAAPISLT